MARAATFVWFSHFLRFLGFSSSKNGKVGWPDGLGIWEKMVRFGEFSYSILNFCFLKKDKVQIRLPMSGQLEMLYSYNALMHQLLFSSNGKLWTQSSPW